MYEQPGRRQTENFDQLAQLFGVNASELGKKTLRVIAPRLDVKSLPILPTPITGISLDGMTLEERALADEMFAKFEKGPFDILMDPTEYILSTAANHDNVVEEQRARELILKHKVESPGEGGIVISFAGGSSTFDAGRSWFFPHDCYVSLDRSMASLQAGKENVFPLFWGESERHAIQFSLEQLVESGIKGLPDVRGIPDEDRTQREKLVERIRGEGVHRIYFDRADMFVPNSIYDGLIREAASMLRPDGAIFMITQASNDIEQFGFKFRSHEGIDREYAIAVGLPLPVFKNFGTKQLLDQIVYLDGNHTVDHYEIVPVISYLRSSETIRRTAQKYGLEAEIHPVRVNKQYISSVTKDRSLYAMGLKAMSILSGNLPYWIVVMKPQNR